MGNGYIGFIIVNTILLDKAVHYETGLVLVDFACSILLNFEDPLATYNISVSRAFNHVPDMGIFQTF